MYYTLTYITSTNANIYYTRYTIQYDTTEEINVDSKAEYTA